jgi:hypothetical protein
MEVKLEKLVKEKEKNVPMAVIPMDVSPITGIFTTTTTTTVEIPVVTSVTTIDASEKMEKSMDDMSLQGQEIKRLEEEIDNLQKLKSTFQSSYNTKCTSHRGSRRTAEVAEGDSHG